MVFTTGTKHTTDGSQAGTRRNDNVFITFKWRRRLRFDVMKTLSLHHYCVMCPLGDNWNYSFAWVPETPGLESLSHHRKTDSFLSFQNHFPVRTHDKNLTANVKNGLYMKSLFTSYSYVFVLCLHNLANSLFQIKKKNFSDDPLFSVQMEQFTGELARKSMFTNLADRQTDIPSNLWYKSHLIRQ